MASSNTCIIGSGIIGLATAYHLSSSPRTPARSIYLIDAAEELFACASGKAAGFIAKDWFGSHTAALAELSFELHRSLAERHGGAREWGFRPSSGWEYTRSPSLRLRPGTGQRDLDWIMDGDSRARAAASPASADVDADSGRGAVAGPEWVRRCEGDAMEALSGEATTAQVDPLRLCTWLLERARERGVQLHQPARVLSVSRDARDEVAGVRLWNPKDGRESDIPCTRVIITAGPWSGEVFARLFPSSDLRLPLTKLAGYSLVLKSPRWTASFSDRDDAHSHAVFTTDASGFCPEFFSRAGGEIWFGGLNSSTLVLPEPNENVDAGGIGTEAVDKLKASAERLLGRSGGGGDIVIQRAGLCFRPTTEHGRPIVCRIPDERLGERLKTRPAGEGGVFIATGHGPWGISLSLGTGQIMAELVEGLEPSADISNLGL